MKGKLKTLEEILKNFKYFKYNKSGNIYLIFHSKKFKNIIVCPETMENFGNIVDISLWKKFDDRVIYRNLKECQYNQLYYDEWFKWIDNEPGLPKPPLEDEFDNLINAIEGW